MMKAFSIVTLLIAASVLVAREPEKIVIKRRSLATEEELRKQLQLVPEAGFDQPGCLRPCICHEK